MDARVSGADQLRQLDDFRFRFHDFGFSLQDLEDFCFRFAMNHMTAVTQTEAFSDLDEIVMKNFIVRAAQSGAFKY